MKNQLRALSCVDSGGGFIKRDNHKSSLLLH